MKDYIVTIQEILSGRNVEFDTAARANHVKLIRHKDNRKEMVIRGEHINNFSLYETYKHDKEKFLHYQGEQSKPIFDNVDFIVSFLGESARTARFIGVFKNNGKLGIKHSEDSPFIYDFSEVKEFDVLNEKIIIDWGEAAVSWHQYYNNIKKVIRIEGSLEEGEGIPTFTSYADINLSYSELKKIIEKNVSSWKAGLKAVNCIYIITDHKTGKHYIGSTYDLSGGMWERWEGYALTGHNENNKLSELFKTDPNYANNLSWAVLETLPFNIAPHEAITRENLYKEKFLTREFGYNDN